MRSGGSEGFRRSSSRTTFTRHVVGARLPEEPLRARAAEGGPQTVDVHDLAQLARHAVTIALVAEAWSAHLEREEQRYRDGEQRLPDGPGRAAAAADADGKRGRRRRARAADARPPGRGGRVVRPRGRPLPRELRARAARELGEADRRDQVADPRRRLARRRGGGALGARARAPPRRSRRSAATPARSRSSSSARTRRRARSPTRSGAATTSRTTSPTRSPRSPPRTSSATSYAVESVLESFEPRDEYLEDMPVADTVIVLQSLASRRGLAAELSSTLLP